MHSSDDVTRIVTARTGIKTWQPQTT